ncbi:MAG: peptidylprolyl isomerase [Planctomycetota bacterium]|nr:peptidylprolyl isomerase [Planctomycetota bacterium]
MQQYLDKLVLTIWLSGLIFVADFRLSAQEPFVLGPATTKKPNTPGGLPATVNAQASFQKFSPDPSVKALDNRLPVVNHSAAGRKDLASEVIGKEFEPGTVVATVGGYPIFRADVMAEINQLIESNMANASESIKAQQRELALPVAVDRAVEQKLLFVDAIRSLPEPGKLAEIKQSIRDQFSELRLPDLMKNLNARNPAEVEAKLRKLGTSLRQAREAWVDGQLAGFFVRDKLNINPEITHEEMLEYYNASRSDYHFPAKVRWEQIMVRFDKFATKEQAWERLGKLGNDIIYGANFVAVAKKSSHGFHADKGGYHDWTSKGSLVHDQIDQALFGIPVNRLSDRIESKIGFHIVRVIERKDEGYVPFNECQDEIKKKIKKEKQDVALKEFVEKLKKEIPVEKFVGATQNSLKN